MTAPFVLFDGKFHDKDEMLFSLGYLKDFLFTESLRVIRNQIIFWDDHLALINLQFSLHQFATPTFNADLKRQIEKTLTKNKLFKSAQIDIHFFTNKGKVKYAIQAKAINETRYELNTEGISLDIFPRIKKAISPVSSLRSGSEFYWDYIKTESSGTEFILQNTSNCLLETPGKNLYLISENSIKTTSPETGAYINPIKRIIQLLTEKIGFNLIETNNISSSDLLEANEIFLANDICGITWVKAFQHKRFFNKISKRLNEELNEYLIQ